MPAKLLTKVSLWILPAFSLLSKIQVYVVAYFLICFAIGADVCITSICAGAILMCVNCWNTRYYTRDIM
jgi:hypothetical protein